MNNVLKGQRGLSPILKSLKVANKARGASKDAMSKAKALKTLKQQYEKTLSEAQAADELLNFDYGSGYAAPYWKYNEDLSRRLRQLETQISNLEFELKLPVSDPYALSNEYYWQYRKTSPELQQSSYRLFGPLSPVDELPKYQGPAIDEIDDLPFKNGGKLKSIF